MKIGLIDVDGHNFPNLALMKLSSYHKSNGDNVEWCFGLSSYDKVYMSKVFTYTPDYSFMIHSGEIVKGGTGYRMYDDLFCDNVEPDYSIYPQYEHAYGFLTRGCIRHCSWCIVPKKEGLIRPYRDIETVLQGKKSAILMDNNVLASEHGIQQIEKIINVGCKVDFNQGLDARLVTCDIAEMLSRVKWIASIRFACDTMNAMDPLINAIEKLNKYGIKNYRLFIYALVKDVDEANRRCEILKKIGVKVFAQPYMDFENNILPTDKQRQFARYVNHTAIFKSTSWENYKYKNKQIC